MPWRTQKIRAQQRDPDATYTDLGPLGDWEEDEFGKYSVRSKRKKGPTVAEIFRAKGLGGGGATLSEELQQTGPKRLNDGMPLPSSPPATPGALAELMGMPGAGMIDSAAAAQAQQVPQAIGQEPQSAPQPTMPMIQAAQQQAPITGVKGGGSYGIRMPGQAGLSNLFPTFSGAYQKIPGISGIQQTEWNRQEALRQASAKTRQDMRSFMRGIMLDQAKAARFANRPYEQAPMAPAASAPTRAPVANDAFKFKNFVRGLVNTANNRSRMSGNRIDRDKILRSLLGV